MKQKYFLAIITLLIMLGCSTPQFSDLMKVDAYTHEIKLPPPFSSQFMEYSTMCSYGDNVLIIPQYPNLLGDDNVPGRGLLISKILINKYVNDKAEVPINVEILDFMKIDFLTGIANYEGFEAVATDGINFYFAIETGGEKPYTYAVKAVLNRDHKQLIFDESSLTKLNPPVTIDNASYESLLLYGNRLYFGYEGNGVNINSEPYVLSTDLNFNNQKRVNIQNLEYRLTDFTSAKNNNEIYAINYHWINDTEKYNPGLDQITGIDLSQIGVERFVPMKITSKGFIPDIKRHVLDLQYKGRNWEGVEYLGDGLLIVTDKYPTSILMYVYE